MKISKLSRLAWLIGCLLAMGSLSGWADVKLPALFSDHMVLQRGMAVPVWGVAAPGESVTVKFRDQTKTVTADAKGKWLVKLDPLTAGGPDTLVVSGGKALEIGDVLVGEVWVGSGQSNMQLPAQFFLKGDPMLAGMVAAAPYPKLRLVSAKTKWREATATNLTEFSALLFAFGARLQEELGVPVGLMVGAVGGTPSAPWLSEEALTNDAACAELIKQYAATAYPEAIKAYEKQLADWKVASAAGKQANKPVERQPVPPAPPGQTADDKVGVFYKEFIRPLMPYAIRGVLWDQGEAGTGLPGVDQYTLMGALIRGWRMDWGEGEFPFLYVQKNSGGGCAWDYADPVTKNADKFVPLPVSVPAFGLPDLEKHIRIMTYPNVGMVISSDLGSGLHPANKFGYGHRAAAVALGMVYGRKMEYYGPVYASHALEGDRVRIHFTHVGQGLAFKNGDKLQGFAVAGANKEFHWADATIDGETVVLSCPAVRQPVHIRYAWCGLRAWANLFNKDGLPAIPFQMD